MSGFAVAFHLIQMIGDAVDLNSRVLDGLGRAIRGLGRFVGGSLRLGRGLLGVLGGFLGVVGGSLSLLGRLLVMRCASSQNESERDYEDGQEGKISAHRRCLLQRGANACTVRMSGCGAPSARSGKMQT